MMLDIYQANQCNDCSICHGCNRSDCSIDSERCFSASLSELSPSPVQCHEGSSSSMSASPVEWKEVCQCPLCVGTVPSFYTGCMVVNAVVIQPDPNFLDYQTVLHTPYEEILKFWPKLPFGIENFWITEFATQFEVFFTADKHPWSFRPVCGTPEPSDGLGKLHFALDAAKVRFSCSKKGHGWTSMKGLVAFWYRLRRSPGSGVVGEVLFKLYGQKCEKCISRREDIGFEEPMWYPEEICKVLVNLKNKVGFTYYGYPQISEQGTRRHGKPSRPHRAELCQACRDGDCRTKK